MYSRVFIFSSAILTFLITNFFWTITSNAFFTSKQFLLLIFIVFQLILMASHIIKSRTVKLSSSPFRYALYTLAVALTLSLFAQANLRLESFVGPVSFYLLLLIWSYFQNLNNSTELRRYFISSLILSLAILALFTILHLTYLSNLTTLPTFLQSRGFTPTGSPLASVTLLLLGIILSGYDFIKTNHLPKYISASSLLLSVLSFVSLGYLLLPAQELSPLLLPLRASWNMALDALKNPTYFFFGVGATNFASFFRSVKPLYLNATSLWNYSPLYSGNEVLQILTTFGMLGLLSFAYLTYSSFVNKIKTSDQALTFIIVFSLISFILAPSSPVMMFVFFTALALNSSSQSKSFELSISNSYLISLPLTLISLLLLYYSSIYFRAEYNLHLAQVALSQNDAKTVYEKSLATSKLLPKYTNYRVFASQVNLSLAAALSQKKDATDADKQNVVTLVSQAINEAKVATTLRPQDSETWRNLGLTYRNLINVADGSASFAIDSFAQAISRDPANPALRLEFGGLLYQIGQTLEKPEEKAQIFNRAQSEFQLAIQLKSDFSNAYYNLSKLLETAGDLNNAYLALQKAISLLGPDNPDLPKATNELSTLKEKLPKPTPSPSVAPTQSSQVETPPEAALSTPTPLPSPIAGGPLEITE